MNTNHQFKIAIVVHGRFHAFNLAHALIQQGHEVHLFTNYPGWAVERFGLSRRYVSSFTLHGILVRSRMQLARFVDANKLDQLFHTAFGRWATAQIKRESWSVIHSWSGVAEEVLTTITDDQTLRTIVRGSSHIRVQDRLLAEEQTRTGQFVKRPSAWMLAREQREYALADQIIVLSSFAKASFLSERAIAERVQILPLGVNPVQFQAPAATVAARLQRIRAGDPLRILYTGSLSLRKGLWDLITIARSLDPAHFILRLVGDVPPESRALIHLLPDYVQRMLRVPEQALPQQYAWADLYLFPSIEDGFAVVLAQAQAAGLPTLTTTNCSGPDLIVEGQTGWVLPIRSPEAFVERLHWCDANRELLAAMVEATAHAHQLPSWDTVARQYTQLWCKASSVALTKEDV